MKAGITGLQAAHEMTTRESAKARRTGSAQQHLARFLVLCAAAGLFLCFLYLLTLPSSTTPRRQRWKRGEREKLHKKYMRRQALLMPKHYAFPKHRFEPDFTAATTLRPTCLDRCSPETCKHVLRSTWHLPCCHTNVTSDTWIFPLLITE